MTDTYTELGIGIGGSKMDERLVPSAATGSTAHRTVVVPGADDARVQTFTSDGAAVRADVSDAAVLAQLAGQVQSRYDVGDATIYVGTSPRGTAANAPLWSIKRTTLVSGVPTQSAWATAVTWDGRAAASYT